MWKLIRHFGIYFAWLITLIMSFTSLYLSNIKKIPPCELCWYLRICLFPLVLILGQAAYFYFRSIIQFIIIFPLMGAIISIYQISYALMYQNQICSNNIECVRMTSLLFNNPLIMPILSLIAFVLIIFFLLVSKRGPAHPPLN